MELHKKYLPIGSIIILNGAKNKLMIIGFSSIDINEKNEIYDYVGCLYPDGVISTKSNIIFNHEDISQVYFIGYEDRESNIFHDNLIIKLNSEEYKRTMSFFEN